ncbi:MAG: glutamyl-tRNA reductase [Bacteroidetes bacterium SB0662_bin_6]|nr:glutamyl-tRNA reductase [Bacteroidetes bacterium SB0668_bin_1]MYE04950.1 glutamyl-tRNA reductase [Bacteroidetes bacterium SB0662_bin_6]
MTFYALGINYLRAPIEVRESFASGWEEGHGLYRNISLNPDSELVLLSTCNRTEAYLYGTEEDVRSVREAFEKHAGRTWPEDLSFLYRDEQAIRHIFEVAAGMKSLIPGDLHIYFQLKEAYGVAVGQDCVNTTMHRLLHTAFRTAKRVINETDLSQNNASIPVRAAEVIKSRYIRGRASKSGEARREGPNAPTVLIVGAGRIGKEAGEALRMLGIQHVSFTNRSEERAREAADRYRAHYVPWEDRHIAAARADTVIVATSAPVPVLHCAEFSPEAGNTPTLIIDISVPRGVEEQIGALPGMELITIDQLGKAEKRTREMLQSSLENSGGIVDEMISEFVSWVFLHQSLQPAIQTIAETFETIRMQEVGKYSQQFSEKDRDQLDRLTRSIVQKLLAVPVVRLKSVDPERIDFAHGVRLLQHLFLRQDCDDEEVAAASNISLSGAVEQEVSRENCPVDAPHSDQLLQDVERTLSDALRISSRDPDTIRHES